MQIPATANGNLSAIEQLVIHGDLSKLTPEQKVLYYKQKCERAGLDWADQPFEYMRLNGKESLYCKRNGTDQLRKLNNISITITDRKIIDSGEICVVTAKARTADGREDESSGAVSIQGLHGEPLANAMMRAETKAKRRVTLSICGLGMVDESEIDSIETDQPSPYQPRKVTQPQLKRLFAISKQCSWTHDQVKEYLKMAFNLEHTSDLTMDQYDVLCSVIQRTSHETATTELTQEGT